MNNDPNRDLYEILEISPNASQETVERMFRYLAQRYHPDRQGTGDADRFDQIVKAYNTLKEPESRAAYDSRHKTNVDYHWSLVEEAGDNDNFEKDGLIQERVLSVLYSRRKRDSRDPGLGQLQLERLTGCPHEMLDFHLWYLRDKGWIMRMENGSVAITADGVDQCLLNHQRGGVQKLLTENSAGAAGEPEPARTSMA
jgi:curved DNA-binding protein CbpA